MPALDPITAIGNVANDILKAVLPDKQAEVQARMAALQAQVQVIVAEAQGKGLASQWRPLLMLCFTFIIVNNYAIAPYLQAMFGWHVALPLPPEMWDLLKLGIGGYVVGRSAEKVATTYIQSKQASPAQFNTNGG